MKVDRKLLLNHLYSVKCGDKVPEATFWGPFATRAVAEDQTVLVETAGVEGLGELDAEVGVLDLDLLVRALGSVDEDEVEATFRDRRLVVTAGRTTLALVTADPENIHTRVTEGDMGAVRGMVPDATAGQLTPEQAAETLSVIGVLQSDEGTLSVGPYGATFRAGRGTENTGEVEWPDVETEASFEVRLAIRSVAAVLERVKSGGPADVRLGGSDSLIALTRDPYAWYLSPLAAEE